MAFRIVTTEVFARRETWQGGLASPQRRIEVFHAMIIEVIDDDPEPMGAMCRLRGTPPVFHAAEKKAVPTRYKEIAA